MATGIKGDSAGDYPASCAPSNKDCAFSRDIAITKCAQCIAKAALGFESNWVGITTPMDISKTLTALVIALIARWAAKKGVQGCVLGYVSAGALAVDAIADASCVMTGIWKIHDAAVEATEKICTCP